MAIEFATTTITVPRALVMTGSETSGEVMGAFLDETGAALYVLAATGASVDATRYWRRIDLTNPVIPTGADWSPSSMTIPNDTNNNDTLIDQNIFFFDPTTGIAWMFFLVWTGSAFTAHIGKITLSTGLVEYATQEFVGLANVKFDNPVRGIVVIGTTLYVLADHAGGNAAYLTKFSISGAAYTTNPALIGTGGNIVATSEQRVILNLQSSRVPVGLTKAADGNLLVFYDDANLCEKYDATSLAYLGNTAWASSDIGCVFERSGFIWTLNDVGSGENFILTKFNDKSTGVISQERSRYFGDDRQIKVNETAHVTLTLQARDGFGAPVLTLSGKFARFEVLTNRGAIDSDDVALSLTNSTANSNFRDANGLPLTRSVLAPFNGSGVAVAYAQSARIAEGDTVTDRVRAAYP